MNTDTNRPPSTKENVWPDRLMIRDTRLHDDMGGGGQRIYTTAGQGYEKREYIRADLVKQPSEPAPATKTDTYRDTFRTAGDLRGAAYDLCDALRGGPHHDLAVQIHDSICMALPEPMDAPIGRLAHEPVAEHPHTRALRWLAESADASKLTGAFAVDHARRALGLPETKEGK